MGEGGKKGDLLERHMNNRSISVDDWQSSWSDSAMWGAAYPLCVIVQRNGMLQQNQMLPEMIMMVSLKMLQWKDQERITTSCDV